MSEREKFEDEETSADPNLGEKQADIIAAIANAAELFHDPDNITYATIKQDGHKETWPVRSKTFRHWLLLRFFQLENTAPDPTALKSGIAVIEARARFVGAERQVHIRTAEHSNKIYLDLVDQRWRVVEIDANGWRVLENCPVKFRRSAGMTSLPVPIAGGTLDALHSCLNVSDIDLVLVAAWLIAALRPRGPYPILVLNGEQGSAKSTFARILRDLIDPNSVPLRALPQGERDLFIAATNGYVINFDNISGLPTWLSDALCRISTGGGWACRALYTDQDETLLNVTRPIVLNGIESMIARPDLGERSIIINLEPIDEARRMTEKELWSVFESKRPEILGALLDAVSTGLRNLDSVVLARRPRLADFATWITASEPALGWKPGTFLEIYEKNQGQTVDEVLQADPVSAAVLVFMEERDEWKGTATELLSILNGQVGERIVKGKNWPAAPNTLSNKLDRASTYLRKAGISFDRGKKEGNKRTRIITLTKTSFEVGKTSSRPSASSAPLINQGFSADDTAGGPANTADDPMDDPTSGTARSNPLKTNDMDDAGDADDLLPTHVGDAQDQADEIEERLAIQEFDGDPFEIPSFLDRRSMAVGSS